MAIVRLDAVSEEKVTQYKYSTVQTLVWCKWGRRSRYKDMENLCAEGVVFGRSIGCHITTVTL
jgi:hypothetical protein